MELDSSPLPQPPSPVEALAQRMKEGICFRCRNKGHWAQNCPVGRSGGIPSASPSPSKAKPSDVPVLHCMCGVACNNVCTSGTQKNPNRRFYSCPGNPPDAKGCEFFAWCDNFTAQQCPCGAGLCRIYARKEGDKIRFSFGCRIKKGFGACSFSQEVDEERSVFALSQVRRMEIEPSTMYSPVYTIQLADVNQDQEMEELCGRKKLDEVLGNLPSAQINNQSDLQEMVTEVVNQGGIASGDPTSEDLAMEDMALLDHISQIDIETPGAIPRDPGIQNWQDEFLKLLLAVEDGPTQGDFPSFNAVKNKFITILDHINPFNLELLRSEAEKCFKILCRLHTVDSGKFIYRVMHYIECASSLANMESSCVPYPSTPLQELKDQCRVKQRGHEDISQLYSQKINAYNTSQGRLKVLLQDAARFRDMLSQTEREIANCEVESLELEMCLKDIKQKVEWSKKSLEAMTREVWEAEDRERKRSAAKDALEKARSQLRH